MNGRERGASHLKSELQSNARAIVGDVLVCFFLLLLLNVCVVMLQRINAVNLKDSYRTIFRYELVLCAVLLAFAFDVRFGFLTMFQAGALIELSGDEETAFAIYYDTYDIHELPALSAD